MGLKGEEKRIKKGGSAIIGLNFDQDRKK